MFMHVAVPAGVCRRMPDNKRNSPERYIHTYALSDVLFNTNALYPYVRFASRHNEY
jgi:hypothetical protein